MHSFYFDCKYNAFSITQQIISQFFLKLKEYVLFLQRQLMCKRIFITSTERLN